MLGILLFITVETWIHHNILETTEQSNQWVVRGESAPEITKVTLLAYKVMARVFSNVRGIIHVDFHDKGKTING